MDEDFSLHQRLKAALHFTVGRLCEDIGGDGGKRFNKEVLAAIAETTYRQCDIFAKDLEAFARHAKRTTVNSEDVKLVARRSTALYNHITRRSEELASTNQEQKERRKKNTGKRKSEDGQTGAGTAGNEDCDMT
ncbi:centromere protein S [Scleropages formosus]|uniref:centromere protein S n=1 Tax=Scleropages formosus TaxID=113540 RepID=UPI0008780383|nr:centromere protein S-like [Scleropages formosus]